MNISGLHHVTAIVDDAKRNMDFYTRILGLRLVKKTVNFDDPNTYHFYFGNEAGDPGTLLTFFPWGDIPRGRRGTRQATEVCLSVPPGSFDFWVDRLSKENVLYNNPSKRFNEEYLALIDPAGLKLELVATKNDTRQPYTANGVEPPYAIRGLHSVTLSLDGYEKTASLLTDLFGYTLAEQEVNRFRFVSGVDGTASIIDLVCLPTGNTGEVGGGSVHHIAFRVKDDAEQEHFRRELARNGYNGTPAIDRDYFKSVYFREPGGVLFEIATDSPGFTTDETLQELGSALMLPKMYESRRAKIESTLPSLD